MRKQLIRRGVWTIGGRRRRKKTGGGGGVGAIPISALAGPVLGGIASNLAGPLLTKLIGG